MSDALLKAVLVDPDDDLPRLVYADWLEENGDPARAEFIRTQIELANLPDHDPRYRQLEDREHELLSEHEPGWLGDEAGRMQEWEWRRGFVDEIANTAQRFQTLSKSFVDAHPFSRVRCSYSSPPAYNENTLTFWVINEWTRRVSALGLSRLDIHPIELRSFLQRADLDRLVEVDFTNNVGVDAVGEIFNASPRTQHLRCLRLGNDSHGVRVEPDSGDALPVTDFLTTFGESPLGEFTAFNTGVTSDGLRTLLAAPFAGTLKHLDISDNPIAPDGYRAFQQYHPAMRLDKLDVSGTPLAGISLEPLLSARSLEHLTKLEMNGCGSARRNMEVLSRSAFWNQATELRAHSGTIPASTLEPLCLSAGPPGLRLLDLADNYLRTEGVRMLADSPWAGSLTWLALSRNYLDDESCEVLAKSGRFTNLRTLHLAHNHFTQDGADGEQITSRGVMALAESPSLANLRLLTLSYTGITDAAVDVVVNAPFWRLFGLGVGGCNLSPTTVRILANSPRLKRFLWLDVSDNPHLRGQALRPLAESPYLSRMCELDCGGIDIADDVRAIFRERLGPRFSH